MFLHIRRMEGQDGGPALENWELMNEENERRRRVEGGESESSFKEDETWKDRRF